MSRRNRRQTYPLRKIVHIGYGDPAKGEYSRLRYETLECGHRQMVKADFIGETNAKARRCKTCYQQAKEAQL